MMEKIKGAIWSYFFRSRPEARSLTVDNISLETEQSGSANVQINNGSETDIVDIKWILRGDKLVVEEASVVRSLV